MSDDQHLVRELLAGQQQAEDLFSERYRGLVIGLARGRFGLGAEEAEELWQATVLRLWEKDRRALRAWQGRGKLSTYLTVIVTHLHLRRRRRRAVATADLDAIPESAAELEDPAPSAEARYAQDQRRRLMARGLSKLSPRDRLVLTLRFHDGRSGKEVAALLGLRPGTARKAVHDAQRRLRRLLQEEHPELFPEAAGNVSQDRGSHSPGDG